MPPRHCGTIHGIIYYTQSHFFARLWPGPGWGPGKRSVTACGLPAGSTGLLALANSGPDQVQDVAGELHPDRSWHRQGLRIRGPGVGVFSWRKELWWPRRGTGSLERRWGPEGPEGLYRGQAWGGVVSRHSGNEGIHLRICPLWQMLVTKQAVFYQLPHG